jgi:tRNA-dihydrouridine synthase 2|tara:strand:- start:1210 stop:1863 length:654 start_codon:yes stop_codon:yes gene_type:complete
MKCAELACKDARVIDINMGCPLKFSITNGAGAALLKKPETIRDILTTLRRNLPSDVGVTCKIRLLANVKDTIELAQAIEKTGVSAIGIHGRNVWQRPRDPAQWDVIKQVVDSVSCPVIANGDIFEYQDFDRIREATGAAAAMAARGAMWNQSIFSKDGLVPPRESLMKLMTKCLEWDHSVNSTKYLARCVFKCFRLASIQLRAGTFLLFRSFPSTRA